MELINLLSFYNKAAINTYIGGGVYEKFPEREGFFELTFKEEDWFYRDSYTGHYRSWGTETIKFQDKLTWCTEYGGGMVEGSEALAESTFGFLKIAMKQKPEKFSARGPNIFSQDDWEYVYIQDGSIENFSGYEVIKYQKRVVFEHKIIGGLIVFKS